MSATINRVPRSSRQHRLPPALRSLLRSPTGSIGVVLVTLFVLAALFAPQLAPFDPNATNLRARQVLAMLEPQANLEASLRLLIEENHRLMGDFIEVWRDSLTPTSLANELEIKFRRDIRVLTEILG